MSASMAEWIHLLLELRSSKKQTAKTQQISDCNSLRGSVGCNGCIDGVPGLCRHVASGLQPGLCLKASLDGLIALTQGCNQPLLQWVFYPVSGVSAALSHINTTLCLHPAGTAPSQSPAQCQVKAVDGVAVYETVRSCHAEALTCLCVTMIRQMHAGSQSPSILSAMPRRSLTNHAAFTSTSPTSM